jgi:hypothetical protein
MNNDDQIKQRFIKDRLQRTAQDITRAVSRKTAGFQSQFWRSNNTNVDDNVMTYKHSKKNRFVDMKSRTLKNGTKKRKRSHAVHNKIVMGNYSELVKELSFGFTEQIRNQFTNMQP